mmetsp:Transcript_11734/g.35678  ORF Transcript_11734/g.35678 Transcript_11734/m.35678 type:complete len:221 (-) Transcript_11734:1501-2163(-)
MAMPIGASRAPEICEAWRRWLSSSSATDFLLPPIMPPTVLPSRRLKAIKITITLTCNQLRKVLSFAKKVLGSILVLTMAFALGVMVRSLDSSSDPSAACFLADELLLLSGMHMMWYSLGPSPVATKRLLTILPTDLFLSRPLEPLVQFTCSSLPAPDGFLPAGAGAFASPKKAGFAFSKYGSLVSAISSKLAGVIPPLPSGRNHHGEFLSLLGYSSAMPF